MWHYDTIHTKRYNGNVVICWGLGLKIGTMSPRSDRWRNSWVIGPTIQTKKYNSNDVICWGLGLKIDTVLQ